MKGAGVSGLRRNFARPGDRDRRPGCHDPLRGGPGRGDLGSRAEYRPGLLAAPDASEATFQAYLKDSGEGPFLRTGDLGFLKMGNCSSRDGLRT